MNLLERVMERWRPRRQRYALALAGGGVIGGMYEVGVIAAIEERLNGAGGFDIYVGRSASSSDATASATCRSARRSRPPRRFRASSSPTRCAVVTTWTAAWASAATPISRPRRARTW